MPLVRRYQPAKISDKTEGRFPLRLIRLCLMELYRLIEDPISIFGGGAPGAPGSGSGPASTLATRIQVTWCANGPYRVDTDVDGAWVVPTACEIANLRLWRGTAGTSGATVVDLKANGSSLYTLNTGNRPALSYTTGDDATLNCNLPDIITLPAGTRVAPDTLTKEGGRPSNWRLTLEVA